MESSVKKCSVALFTLTIVLALVPQPAVAQFTDRAMPMRTPDSQPGISLGRARASDHQQLVRRDGRPGDSAPDGLVEGPSPGVELVDTQTGLVM